MKLLLDTHTILWFWWDDPRLGPKAREAIANASNRFTTGTRSTDS